MSRLLRLIVFVCAGLVLNSAAEGQIRVDRNVLDCGGQPMAGPNHQLTGTVSQAVSGVTAGASSILEFGFWYVTGDPITGAGDGLPGLPLAHALDQNYPNPFNPVTKIAYALPVASHVSMRIYDLAGRQVRSLVDQEMPAGYHEVAFSATGLSSGIYLCRMVADTFVQTRKMTLIK